MNRVDFAFHGGLFWKEWHKSKGMFLAFLAYMLYIHPISLVLGMNRAVAEDLDRAYPFIRVVLRRLQPGGADGWALIALIAGVVISAQLMGEERRGRTIEFVLAMPFSRGQMFFNKYLFGLASFVAVYLINALSLAVVVAANYGVLAEYIEFYTIAQWLWTQVVLFAALLSFTLVFSMIAGNSIASIVLTVVFLAFPVGIAGLIRDNAMIIFNWSWGEVAEYMNFLDVGADLSLFSYFFADGDILLSRWPFLLLFSAVLFLVGQRLFVRNPMERNGELLMFYPLERVLRVGVTVCAMLLAGSFFRPYDGGLTLALIARYLVGGAFGYWVTETAIARSRAKG